MGLRKLVKLLIFYFLMFLISIGPVEMGMGSLSL